MLQLFSSLKQEQRNFCSHNFILDAQHLPIQHRTTLKVKHRTDTKRSSPLSKKKRTYQQLTSSAFFIVPPIKVREEVIDSDLFWDGGVWGFHVSPGNCFECGSCSVMKNISVPHENISNWTKHNIDGSSSESEAKIYRVGNNCIYKMTVIHHSDRTRTKMMSHASLKLQAENESSECTFLSISTYIKWFQLQTRSLINSNLAPQEFN